MRTVSVIEALMKNLTQKLFDNTRGDSFVTRLRRKRLELFWHLLHDLPRPVRIIDIGGTTDFWNSCGVPPDEKLEITIVNLEGKVQPGSDFAVRAGNACNLESIGDNEFDVAFSNSVIEHVGDIEDQGAMAREVLRVAPLYYVQTPNYYFPIEPHFLFPAFQWLPISVRVFLIRHFQLGYMKKKHTPEMAKETIAHTQLLSRRQLTHLFPNGHIAAERLFGLAKSYIVHSDPKSWSS
jgi:hypothetical protein